MSLPRFERGDLAPQRRHGAVEVVVGGLEIDLDEVLVGLAIGLEIAGVRDLPVLEDQDLVAHRLDIAEQVRGEDDPAGAAVADVADEIDHPLAGRWIEAVGRLVEHEQPGPVDQGLGELDHLLHPGGEGAHLAVARLAETDVEERLVGSFEGGLRRQAAEFGHEPDEVDRGDVGDIGVGLGHVADLGADLFADDDELPAEDPSAARGRRVEAEQGAQQGGLAGAVGSEQTDGPAGERGFEPIEDRPTTELDGQTVKLEDGRALVESGVHSGDDSSSEPSATIWSRSIRLCEPQKRRETDQARAGARDQNPVLQPIGAEQTGGGAVLEQRLDLTELRAHGPLGQGADDR